MARILIATRPVLTTVGEFTTGEPREARDDREFEALKKHPSWRVANKDDLEAWDKRLENDPVLKASRAKPEADDGPGGTDAPANKKEGESGEGNGKASGGKAGSKGSEGGGKQAAENKKPAADADGKADSENADGGDKKTAAEGDGKADAPGAPNVG